MVPNLFGPADWLGKAEHPPALMRMREGTRGAHAGMHVLMHMRKGVRALMRAHTCSCEALVWDEHPYTHVQRVALCSGGTHTHVQKGGRVLMWAQACSHRRKQAVQG